MRIELTRVGLLVYLANHYTTRGAQREDEESYKKFSVTVLKGNNSAIPLYFDTWGRGLLVPLGLFNFHGIIPFKNNLLIFCVSFQIPYWSTRISKKFWQYFGYMRNSLTAPDAFAEIRRGMNYNGYWARLILSKCYLPDLFLELQAQPWF